MVTAIISALALHSGALQDGDVQAGIGQSGTPQSGAPKDQSAAAEAPKPGISILAENYPLTELLVWVVSPNQNLILAHGRGKPLPQAAVKSSGTVAKPIGTAAKPIGVGDVLIRGGEVTEEVTFDLPVRESSHDIVAMGNDGTMMGNSRWPTSTWGGAIPHGFIRHDGVIQFFHNPFGSIEEGYVDVQGMTPENQARVYPWQVPAWRLERKGSSVKTMSTTSRTRTV